MLSSSMFIFQDEKEGGRYDLYLFKDFSGIDENVKDEVAYVIDEIRQRIHFPETVFIIVPDITVLDENKIKGRFTNNQKIEYINYENIEEKMFHKGINSIVATNKVVQYAPKGTRFKKTSGDESDIFIKASLALIEYSQICFLALALHQKISDKKIEKIKKFYIDTSSIISLIQTLISYRQKFKNCKFMPQIINFKSYTNSNIDFNTEDAFTIISATTSGNLRKNKDINSDKCLTLFYSASLDLKDVFLFKLENIHKNKDKTPSPKLILLTSEDFSLEYSKAQEVIILKKNIIKLDEDNVIDALLTDAFKKIDFKLKFNDIQNRAIIHFDELFIHKVLEDNKFLNDVFSRSLLSEKDNCIICDRIEFKNLKTENITYIAKTDFLSTSQKEINHKNVIVYLIQATDKELIHISQKLRDYEIHNITYIIGVLITDNLQQAKNVKNNICFNDTKYKYDFYSYLNLPLSQLESDEIGEYKLSNGFVFYKHDNSKDLNPKQVYLVIAFVLELLRSSGQLTDNTTYHDVLSPKNFSRFNDSLLQISLLRVAKGRELNFQSNSELSHEMKDVILDFMKEKNELGRVFLEALKNSHIRLTEKDYLIIKDKYPDVFTREETI